MNLLDAISVPQFGHVCTASLHESTQKGKNSNGQKTRNKNKQQIHVPAPT